MNLYHLEETPVMQYACHETPKIIGPVDPHIKCRPCRVSGRIDPCLKMRIDLLHKTAEELIEKHGTEAMEMVTEIYNRIEMLSRKIPLPNKSVA